MNINIENFESVLGVRFEVCVGRGGGKITTPLPV